MTTEERQSLFQQRSALIAERDAELAAVHRRYERRLNAYDVLLETPQPVFSIKPNIHQLPAIKGIVPPIGDPIQPPQSLFDAVKREILSHAKKHGPDSEFTSATLFETISAKYPSFAKIPSDLSNALWRLKKSEDIELVREGNGRVPNAYRIKFEEAIEP